ncbi:MAG: ABC transporter ATP-binding protein [Candidatus Odinarchaeota archaeon]
MILVECREIEKEYQDGSLAVKAIEKISLTISKGDYLAITGPSGSGKTTLINLIGALTLPTEGEVIIKGKKTTQLSSSELADIRRNEIGYIFQLPNLIPSLSVIENVEIPLILQRITRQQRLKLSRLALEEVNLLDRLAYYPYQLSGGEQQRVAIARAIVHSPEMILCDEPTGSLDYETSSSIEEILRNLNINGHTIVMVTHDLLLASRTKKNIKLKDGKIIN